MKYIFILLILVGTYSYAIGKETFYEGSTPAHTDVRKFLGISLTDSIDFIIWALRLSEGRYDLDCRYGLSKPSTPGFMDEKKAVFSGTLIKQGTYYQLQQGSRIFYILEINTNLLQLLNKNKAMLIGNGGYSYTLNSDKPLPTSPFNLPVKENRFESTMVFEGRTPCQVLAKMMGLEKSAACDKMKWYIIFYSDPQTHQPTYYLEGGRGYKKETMSRGKWEIIRSKDGKTIFKLDPDKKFNVFLLKADDNILLFTDSQGNLLVGNRYFSYTLNRTHER